MKAVSKFESPYLPQMFFAPRDGCVDQGYIDDQICAFLEFWEWQKQLRIRDLVVFSGLRTGYALSVLRKASISGGLKRAVTND
jgi:hypothetical protein